MKAKRLFNYIGAGLLALSSVSLLACTEIEDGYNDIDSWPDVTDYSSKIQHPCMLHTDADFEFVKSKIDAGEQPWKNAFVHLEQNSHAQAGQVASPVKLLARLDQNNWQSTYPDDWSNYTKLMRDAASAYQLALRWRLSGDDEYAATAVNMLNAWAATCTGFIVNSNGEFIDPNEFLILIQVYQLANAAEILRSYEGWKEADFTTYKNWMVDVFYPHATKFLSLHNGYVDCPLHYWLNWDLAAMNAILSIGILTDDSFKINEAIQYFKFGVGSGNIGNAVPFVHQDPDSSELLGQCQESGRDQGHATLCVSLMGVFCQMAKNIGEDLFIFDNNRALAMCEYVAKYNYGETEEASGGSWKMINFKYDVTSLPYTAYENCTGDSWPSISYQEHKEGKETRGEVRPAWELVKRLASDYGQSSIYADMWVSKMRENVSRGYSDGMAGDYGPNSGGYDQLGCGTLMFAR
ncbi:alginate lyase family protein [uncultured Bacteroides sp.]|jgi:hypothetical protein|uniref:alginate lyase family protein n=1 Tax=uncultured Bacteroides sp. TaxID=162156 RepID=UPI00280AD82E|nr:alginate lyase family protein [uncultured Bacteroides sp.]